MPEILEKLRPDRDLQCYFERPSAAAALSASSASGFTLSGSWRQQLDWAVIEWNRDNVFEHPLFRNLPDGNLSGLQLTYEESRSNSIPLDSALFPTVDWPYLRVWATAGGAETVYKVRLRDHATPVAGSYQGASGVFDLQGTATAGDWVELAWLSEHYSYQLTATDTLADAAAALAASINAQSASITASQSGTQITLHYASGEGHNGNRVGVYANVAGAGTESWSPASLTLSGGTSPSKWRIQLNFGALVDIQGASVPAGAVRKLRWTYAADQQTGSYVRGDFQVVVSNWAVTGSNRTYEIAGPGSRRIEDDRSELAYSGTWTESRGNFSGGSIRSVTTVGASASLTYREAQNHRLYLGTRKLATGTLAGITVDGVPTTESLTIAGEDVLARLPLGNLAGGVDHTVTVTHNGPTGSSLYFDFFEIAIPATNLPVVAADGKMTLATDWDTDHSIALAPERTAWMIHSLGFRGRHNYYVGALWFYELWRQGHSYASGTVQLSGSPVFSQITTLTIGQATIQHVNLTGDTAASIAKAFELEINNGYTGVWASSSGAVLTVTSRLMGAAGNAIALAASPASGAFQAQTSGTTLAGGVDGDWRTDLNALPRVNRAATDWSRAFFKALKGYGLDAAAAFSMELQHGDPSAAAGIAQRYPNGGAVLLNTPALQTNFSPASLAFWKQAYLEMAGLMAQAGMTPYLQFGEVQWWYFPDASGMPFYDTYTTSTFSATYGRPMHVFANSQENPALYPEEAQFLPGLIGAFTNAVMQFVRQSYPAARFEALYPPDVNDSPLNRVINLPAADWTPAALDNLKTENFTYTGLRDLNKCLDSMRLPIQLGFPRSQSSHLVGNGDYTTPWLKEVGLAKGEGVESVVLFALDQFCLIGYEAPLERGERRSLWQG